MDGGAPPEPLVSYNLNIEELYTKIAEHGGNRARRVLYTTGHSALLGKRECPLGGARVGKQ